MSDFNLDIFSGYIYFAFFGPTDEDFEVEDKGRRIHFVVNCQFI